jgi:serine/threonine protein kinase
MCPPVHNCRQVLDVAIGLEHLHSLKLVHGDLKAVRESFFMAHFQPDQFADRSTFL